LAGGNRDLKVPHKKRGYSTPEYPKKYLASMICRNLN
jgi:hypothetical protein